MSGWPTSLNVVCGYVTRLKAALRTAGEPGAALTRGQGGYVLHADPESVDLFRFRRLTVQARAAACDEEAARLLGEALGLWHGEALAGLASPWLDGRARLWRSSGSRPASTSTTSRCAGASIRNCSRA
ncbi:MAG TPA: BTAD domain-containing putative transcriptional regulator [Streptosporangiaceae bacterium]|nr:BTAD domain-containing putative transcriptional regulator [Streptosporangiaceae bacterium]